MHTQVLKSTKHWEINLSVHPPNSLGTGWDCIIYKERTTSSKGMWLTQSKKATDTLRWHSNSSILHLFFSKKKNFKAVLALKRQKQEDCQEFQANLSYIMRLYLKTNKQAHTLFQRKKEDKKKKKERERQREREEKKKRSTTKEKLSLREINSI